MPRVTVLELPATWGDPRASLDAAAATLEHGPPTDLLLLPEASLTGYVSPAGDFDLAPFAEPDDGPTAQAIAALARHRQTNIVAPLVLSEGERRYNAMVAFDRRGERIFTYRKRHPWLPEAWATPGPHAAPIACVEGLRVTIAICFDVHFLAEDASAALDGADLLLFPSAWVEEHDSRRSMLAEIARRHRIVIANANWGAGVVRMPGQGGSSILAADGGVLADVATSASSAPPRVMRADADIDAISTRCRREGDAKAT